MSRLVTLGHWPFLDETETAPINYNAFDYFGDGSGVVNDLAATTGGSFPLSFETKTEAMRYFFRVREWSLYFQNGPVTINTDLTHNIADEDDLILQQNGIDWGNATTDFGGGITLVASIAVCNVPEVNSVQVKHQPNTDLWYPRIEFNVQMNDNGSVSGNEYLVQVSNYLPLGPDLTDVDFDGNIIVCNSVIELYGPVTLILTPSVFWGHDGTYDTGTGDPL